MENIRINDEKKIELYWDLLKLIRDTPISIDTLKQVAKNCYDITFYEHDIAKFVREYRNNGIMKV